MRITGRREGELTIDHRSSPGLPEYIARWAGYDPAQVREGKLYEAPTMTCSHCKIVVVKNPFRNRPRENCPKCNNRYVCDWCYAQMKMADYDHMPFEKVVELTIRKPFYV